MMEPEQGLEQDLVDDPPTSRPRMMENAGSPTKFANFGGENQILGAKSLAEEGPTDRLGGMDSIGVPINGINVEESGFLPGDKDWTV